MKSSKFTPPYLGAAYYPEAWPMEQIDRDIALMKEAGMTAMRIGEFAWSRMEPEEGEFDFDWLHLVVKKLGEAGIATIMCTPTCTPPVWLTGRHPGILFMFEDGTRAQHGGRRHACINNGIFIEYCRRIVTRMGEEFGQDDNIIGWQVDNEICPYGERERQLSRDGRGCCCPVCQNKFRERLKRQFGTIEALNKAWGTNVWSQTYRSFDQIPYPGTGTWHHPSLRTAWMLFKADSCIDFIGDQAEILHKLTKQPVGTDMIPIGTISYHKMNKKLDLVQMNHYTETGNSLNAAFIMDLARPVKDVPFWNTETAVCWYGGSAAGGYMGPDYCRGNSWLSIALGGEATCYWLWRAHWSGQELMFGSVVTSTGRPIFNFAEVQEVSAGFKAAGAFLANTTVKKPSVALHYSNLALWTFQFQPMVSGFKYMDSLFKLFYRPIAETQIRMDVIEPESDLSAYRLLYSPFLPALDEGGLRERLLKWIEDGGTWIAGPMTDNRTVHGTKFTHSPFGSLEEWAGVYCKYELPFDNLNFALNWKDGTESTGAVYSCGFEPCGAETFAAYGSGPLKGLSAVVGKKTGKGQIILLGTVPNAEDVKRLTLFAAGDAGIEPAAEASSNILYVPREGQAGKGAVVVEHENRPGYLVLKEKMTDLLTGKELLGKIELGPYAVLVLKQD